jgi:hypothetical protein
VRWGPATQSRGPTGGRSGGPRRPWSPTSPQPRRRARAQAPFGRAALWPVRRPSPPGPARASQRRSTGPPGRSPMSPGLYLSVSFHIERVITEAPPWPPGQRPGVPAAPAATSVRACGDLRTRRPRSQTVRLSKRGTESRPKTPDHPHIRHTNLCLTSINLQGIDNSSSSQHRYCSRRGPALGACSFAVRALRQSSGRL